MDFSCVDLLFVVGISSLFCRATQCMYRLIHVFFVLDLRIDHDRFGSSSYPSLNGHLHHPNDIDKSLNETSTDMIFH